MEKFKVILFAIMLIPACAAMAQKNINDEYPIRSGHLRFISSQINFKEINNNETKTDTIKMYNDWSENMSLNVYNLPDYITCRLIPDQLWPQQKGIAVFTFDASKRNDFGNVFEKIIIATNDSIRPGKMVTIAANITEDFSKLTAEQMQNAAKIMFENTTYDFGTTKEGEKIVWDFKFTNTGNNDLFIRKVKAGCGCTATNADKSQVKKNEWSFIHVSVDTKGRAGLFHKTVTVICNDPVQSTIILNINGKIEKTTE